MQLRDKCKLPIEKNGSLVKIGTGELGGKALSFPFMESVIDLRDLSAKIAPHEVRIPETWVLATGIFDSFIAENDLFHCVEASNDEEVRIDFLRGELPADVVSILQEFVEKHKNPIAVRSSALSEDATEHPAAGLYCTFMLPNNSPSNALAQLQDAVKLVYASLFTQEAREYLKGYNIPLENEKMAVILEEVVGNVYDNYFFPLIAGVAQSINFFPIGGINTEDGAATIALGLGRKVVDGLGGMRFCPKYPTLRPQFRSMNDILSCSQEDFYAVDLSKGHMGLQGEETETLKNVSVGSLAPFLLDSISSILDEESGIIRDCPTIYTGKRIIAFNQFLQQNLFPLPSVLDKLLKATQEGFCAPVELEFALKHSVENGQKKYILYLLQARSMPALKQDNQIVLPAVPREQTLISTDKIMGHGALDDIKYILFIDPKDFSRNVSPRIANEIAYINEMMVQKKESYLLLGPGRWGSCNHGIGIPVTYSQVSGARLIAEISTDYLRMEPSQGSHFFHNVVSGKVFYLTVDDKLGAFINWDWLRKLPNTADTNWVKLLTPEERINIRVDACSRRGLIYFEPT